MEGAMSKRSPGGSVTPADYETLAAFRLALRRFLAFSAADARDSGLSPVQHQALLAIKGSRPGGTLSIGELAELLDRRPHSTVGLVDRLVRRGLARRAPDRADRRRVGVRLTPRGESLLGRLSVAHRDELRRLGPELQRVLEKLSSPESRGP
jgi:DNA-binding MarR family transcriptional regulator